MEQVDVRSKQGPAISRPIGEWIPARPFRVYLLDLLAASDLTLDELAELVTIPRQAARRLAYGRHDGRPVRRISPDVARRLLRFRYESVFGLDQRAVPSALIIAALVDLIGADASVEAVAERVGTEPAVLWSVLTGETTCSQRLVVRVRAAAEELMGVQFRAGLRRSGPRPSAAPHASAA